jgi:ABC-2 type transport system ATP-binding protein
VSARTDTPLAPAWTAAPDGGALAIASDSLARRFGAVEAVAGVSLAVERGAVFGLLGPDGAGKSTLITILATVQRTFEGSASILGMSVCDDAEAIKPHIGYMSQRFSMYPDLTVAENLEFFARIRGIPAAQRRERSRRLLEQMGMAQFGRRLADKLSGGMKQKLMLASTLMTEPDVLLLDEPTTGVDPVSRREFWRIIAGLHRAGKTVFVATPYMDEAERCTHIAFMDHGRITATGTPDEIKSRVEGTLIEIVATPQREAPEVLAAEKGVASAHILGDSIRVLARPGGPSPEALAELLGKSGHKVHSAEKIAVDMEAAYAYLAERRESAGEPS